MTMVGHARVRLLWTSLLLAVLLPLPLPAQGLYGFRIGDRVGDEVLYRPRGVNIYTEALDPTIRRSYLPASMFSERDRRGLNLWVLRLN